MKKINKMTAEEVWTALEKTHRNCPGSLYERHLQAREETLRKEWEEWNNIMIALDDDLYDNDLYEEV